MEKQKDLNNLLSHTTNIVSAYISNNQVEIHSIEDLTKSVFNTLKNIYQENLKEGASLTPAIAIEESVKENYIICLEDGKKLKMLKRHLRTAYNMSPEEYKKRWNLPKDYPTVAPSYAKQRSRLAKNIGLGKKTGKNIFRTHAA